MFLSNLHGCNLGKRGEKKGERIGGGKAVCGAVAAAAALRGWSLTVDVASKGAGLAVSVGGERMRRGRGERRESAAQVRLSFWPSIHSLIFVWWMRRTEKGKREVNVVVSARYACCFGEAGEGYWCAREKKRKGERRKKGEEVPTTLAPVL